MDRVTLFLSDRASCKYFSFPRISFNFIPYSLLSFFFSNVNIFWLSLIFHSSAYLGPLLRDLIYFHDSLPTFVGSNQNLLNISKVHSFENYILGDRSWRNRDKVFDDGWRRISFLLVHQFLQMEAAVMKWHTSVCSRPLIASKSDIVSLWVWILIDKIWSYDLS